MKARGTPGWIEERHAAQVEHVKTLCQLCGLTSENLRDQTIPESFLTFGELAALCTKASSTPEGCFVEVGVCNGGSAFYLNRLAQRQQRLAFLYDTFTGIPMCDRTQGDTLEVGAAHGASIETVRAALGGYPYIEACVFPHADNLPIPPIAFAHIDVDQYQSHIETCRALEPLMAKGGVMWFDDVPVLEGARKAVRELYGDRIQVGEYERWFVVFE